VSATATASSTEPPASPEASSTPQGAELDPEMQAFVETVGERTSELRALPLPADVPVRVIPREDLRETLDSLYRPQDLEDLDNLSVLYRLLGFIDDDDDLYSVYQGFTEGAVAGFYVPDVDELYVVQDGAEFSGSDESTLAHEWTHAIQDEAFDLTAAADAALPGDPEMALTAVVEGDAIRTQLEYTEQFVDDGLASLFDDDSLGDALDALQVLLQTPEPIQREQYFPYEAGPAFLQAVTTTGELYVDEVFQRLPVSTAEIMHPELYLAGWQPAEVSPSTIDPGDGWTQVLQTSLGEFQLYNWLTEYVGGGQASEAAAGWTGDSLGVYENATGQSFAVLHVTFSSDAEEQEFFNALSEVQSGADGQTPEGAWVHGDDDDMTLFHNLENGAAVVWTDSGDAMRAAADQMQGS
jgi:hypothetical protein